jgi:hypothetical protein
MLIWPTRKPVRQEADDYLSFSLPDHVHQFDAAQQNTHALEDE